LDPPPPNTPKHGMKRSLSASGGELLCQQILSGYDDCAPRAMKVDRMFRQLKKIKQNRETERQLDFVVETMDHTLDLGSRRTSLVVEGLDQSMRGCSPMSDDRISQEVLIPMDL
jgi:hypothetical protein